MNALYKLVKHLICYLKVSLVVKVFTVYLENAIYLNFKGLYSFLFNKMRGNRMD